MPSSQGVEKTVTEYRIVDSNGVDRIQSRTVTATGWEDVLPPKQREVYGFLRQHIGEGFTRDDLAERLGSTKRGMGVVLSALLGMDLVRCRMPGGRPYTPDGLEWSVRDA